MQDRPNFDELLNAVERFLDDEVVGKTEGALRFNGRVAANVIRIVRRELENEEASLGHEWESLVDLLGEAPRPRDRDALRAVLTQRNEGLSQRIRAGDADDGEFRGNVLKHARQTIREKLTVTNPRWLE